jgi:hypothetical protein
LTKTFDFVLPLIITTQSLQVSFDIVDILAHNSVEKNRKLTLDTSQIQPDTLIFNCKREKNFDPQGCFNFMIDKFLSSFKNEKLIVL